MYLVIIFETLRVKHQMLMKGLVPGVFETTQTKAVVLSSGTLSGFTSTVGYCTGVFESTGAYLETMADVSGPVFARNRVRHF